MSDPKREIQNLDNQKLLDSYDEAYVHAVTWQRKAAKAEILRRLNEAETQAPRTAALEAVAVAAIKRTKATPNPDPMHGDCP